MVIVLVTCHNLLASLANREGIINDDRCRECREVGMRETVEHFHYFCAALSRTRLRYLVFALDPILFKDPMLFVEGSIA